MIDLKNVKLEDIMPPNLLQDEKVKKLAAVLSNELQSVSLQAYELNFNNVDELPEPVIDHLLWENHIFPDEGLNLAQTLDEKRNLLKNSTSYHQKKGTPYAIEQALEMVNLTGNVLEWYEYDGAPYYFKIELEHDTLTQETLKNLRQFIESSKNERSWLESIDIMTRESLALIHHEYDFAVPYRITNTFQTADVPGSMVQVEATLQESVYGFEVLYPITNTFVTSTIQIENTELNVIMAEEYRDNDVLYKRAGTIYAGEGVI